MNRLQSNEVPVSLGTQPGGCRVGGVRKFSSGSPCPWEWIPELPILSWRSLAALEAGSSLGHELCSSANRKN